jgi:hypothetical protein
MTQLPPQNVQYQPQPPAGSGLGIASLVVGIIACVVFCIPVLPWLLGILAIVLGAIALAQAGPVGNGKAKTGLILGVLGLALSVGFWMAARAGLSFLHRKVQEKAPEWQKQMEEAQKRIEEEQKKREQEMQKQNNAPATQPGSMLPRPMRIERSGGVAIVTFAPRSAQS